MRKTARTLVLAGLSTLAAVSSPAWHATEPPPAPTGVKEIDAGGVPLVLWPYTTSDFATPSDPVNLVFPNADPRAIRQRLMRLDGQRPAFAGLPGSDCTWTDAMGYEQAAYGEPEGWVGGAVQLACVTPGAPLGSPFRFHVRLFRQGDHTHGNAHFELLIPGTAEHEVLSWDLARELVAYDMGRTGRLTAVPALTPVIVGGAFRTVRRPVFLALVQMGASDLLEKLKLVLPEKGDVPILTSGEARVLSSTIHYRPRESHATTTTRVDYSIVVPKPFCAKGPYDLVLLQGPLDFSMTVKTDRRGRYERQYLVGGTLRATPMRPTSPTTFEPTGEPAVDAVVYESHRAVLSDRRAQVSEKAAQVLLGDPRQSLSWRFAAGGYDRFARELLCGTE
jgi:hypothetical protein